MYYDCKEHKSMKIRKLILSVLAGLMMGALSLTGCSKPESLAAGPEEPKKEESAETEEIPEEEASAGDQETPEKDTADFTDIDIETAEDPDQIDYDGIYTSKEDVSLYLYTYGELPSNFITKKEAKSLGWSGGSLEPYAPGCCIGGDRFGNYEGNLPDGDYHECDIDTLYQKSRGAKRLVYSEDGRIYYTEDHYKHFELLYGEE